MNNEEMAMSLTNFDPKIYELHKDVVGQEDIENKEKYETAIEMANWKDEQLNEIVQKAWELFQQYATYMHPRKGIEMCVMNKQQFLKAINYANKR